MLPGTQPGESGRIGFKDTISDTESQQKVKKRIPEKQANDFFSTPLCGNASHRRLRTDPVTPSPEAPNPG